MALPYPHQPQHTFELPFIQERGDFEKGRLSLGGRQVTCEAPEKVGFPQIAEPGRVGGAEIHLDSSDTWLNSHVAFNDFRRLPATDARDDRHRGLARRKVSEELVDSGVRDPQRVDKRPLFHISHAPGFRIAGPGLQGYCPRDQIPEAESRKGAEVYARLVETASESKRIGQLTNRGSDAEVDS